MKLTLLERLSGLVIWPKNRNPRIKGPQSRIITIEQAMAIECHQKGMENSKENENEMVQ